MTGQRSRPKELHEKLSQLIRYEQRSMPTASLARIKDLDEETRRATIETVPDGATESNVPVASPFAGDGVGDFAPLNPETRDEPVRGVVLYLHHGLDAQLATPGFEFDGQRDHDETHAIFLPAQIWFDHDSVPDHDADERVVSHTDGNKLSFTDEHAKLEHHLGAALEILGKSEPEYEAEEIINEERDYVEEWGEEFVDEGPDNTSWPIADEQNETAGRISHPDGPAVTVTERGVAVENADRKLTTGPFTSGERQPLAGRFQHFHIKHNTDGSADLVGPQLSFREFIAWMTDSSRQTTLNNADEYADARQFAENYLAWLEDEVGRTLDPTDAEHWPDPEPMPTPDEYATFAPYGNSISVGTTEATVGTPTPTIRTEDYVPEEYEPDPE